jgi:site-specific DNA-methyltransferase (adenine-specific)
MGGPADSPADGAVLRHRGAELYQDDCLRWLSERAPESVHAVVTDPPYGLVEYDPGQQRKLRAGRGGVWRIPPSFDGHRRSPLPRFTTLRPADLAAAREFFLAWGRAVLPVLMPGGHLLVAANPLVSPYVGIALAEAGLERRGELVRLVMTMRGGDRPKNHHIEFADVTVMPRSQWEPWLVYRRPLGAPTVAENLRRYGTGGLRRISAQQPFGDVIPSRPAGRAERRLAAHPSLKPQEFLRRLVRAALPLGEGVVLDPFAGSGSTLAAACALGVRSIGVELDPHYVRVAGTAIPALAAL